MSASGDDRDYDAFAARIVEGGVLTDPWIDGKPRFRSEPVFVQSARQRAMYRAAADVAEVYEELCRIVEGEPELLDTFFALTPFQKAMWIASSPMWHGIARADVFVTDEGYQIAELNCDTPTGEAEAVILNALVAEEHGLARDPNAEMEARFCAMVEAIGEHGLRGWSGAVPRTVGLVYPTEFTEDLSLVRLYRKWFEDRGFEVVLGSPYNLEGGPEGLRLFDVPVPIVLRHYKTDWWGERMSAWDDETIADVKPLEGPLTVVFDALLDEKVAVVNPFGAVLPQNKRAMAFMWEHVHRFSPRAQEVIREYVPPTQRLERVHEERLFVEKDQWVLKSDYGAEGEEVILGVRVTDDIWRASIAHARPGRWIAQRYFHAEEDDLGETVNYGVYLIAGEPCGLYARVQTGPTDDRAFSAPCLVVG